MPDFKILIIIFIPVFIFMFFLGILSGNTLLIVFGRSLAGTLFLVIIVTAAFAVMKKMISGIMPNSSKSSDPDESGPESFDVVLDGENPYENENIKTYSAANNNSDTEEEEADVSGSFVEEVEEESMGDISFIDNPGDSEETVEVMNDSSMPEIDSNPLVLDNEESKSNRNKNNDTLNILGNNIDAGTMAKAVKSILTRDDKG
ncbi:MAG: hypothetical protein RBT69_02515 [Spirochaetia bacterium]|nr:hypothetical protein [Spirochaetia bacterium]